MPLQETELNFGKTDAPMKRSRHSCAQAGSKLASGGWREVPRSEHFVQIYEDDAHLVQSLAEYSADALWRGERLVVIATPAHRSALDERLRSYGIDIASALVTRQYATCD